MSQESIVAPCVILGATVVAVLVAAYREIRRDDERMKAIRKYNELDLIEPKVEPMRRRRECDRMYK